VAHQYLYAVPNKKEITDRMKSIPRTLQKIFEHDMQVLKLGPSQQRDRVNEWLQILMLWKTGSPAGDRHGGTSYFKQMTSPFSVDR
jgi:hypothetical protein